MWSFICRWVLPTRRARLGALLWALLMLATSIWGGERIELFEWRIVVYPLFDATPFVRIREFGAWVWFRWGLGDGEDWLASFGNVGAIGKALPLVALLLGGSLWWAWAPRRPRLRATLPGRLAQRICGT